MTTATGTAAAAKAAATGSSPPGRFEDNQARLQRLELRHQDRDGHRIIGGRPLLLGRVHRQIERGFRDIDPKKDGGRLHELPPCLAQPWLIRARRRGSGNCSGSTRNGRRGDLRFFAVSRDLGGNGLLRLMGKTPPPEDTRGAIVALYEAPPAGSVVVCLDEMGPEAAKSHPGHGVIRPAPTGVRRVRAKQEIDYGRRGKGYVFGAFQPTTGAAFLDHVEGWLDPAVERIYAVLDNLSTHRALDVLLWALVHLMEPWWNIVRSLALKGRRFASWEDVRAAVAAGTAYWNNHRHPFVWGRRRRRRAARSAGIAHRPLAA